MAEVITGHDGDDLAADLAWRMEVFQAVDEYLIGVITVARPPEAEAPPGCQLIRVRPGMSIVVAGDQVDDDTWFGLPKLIGGAVAVLDPDGARELAATLTRAAGIVIVS